MGSPDSHLSPGSAGDSNGRSNTEGDDQPRQTTPPAPQPVDSFTDGMGSDASDSFDYPFDSAEIGDALRTLSSDVLNTAPFGIIRLDDEGVVQFYNEQESNFSGVAPEEAQGQNFFVELAPCSNNSIFRGRFDEGVQNDDLDERFTYTFTYKMRPTLVDVHMYRDEAAHNWIMIRKR